jgi:hypothetical protein
MQISGPKVREHALLGFDGLQSTPPNFHRLILIGALEFRRAGLLQHDPIHPVLRLKWRKC